MDHFISDIPDRNRRDGGFHYFHPRFLLRTSAAYLCGHGAWYAFLTMLFLQ